MGFVDKEKNIKYPQTYPLSSNRSHGGQGIGIVKGVSDFDSKTFSIKDSPQTF